MATAEFIVTMKHNGYVAFGFASDSRGAMNGSYAVIAQQTKGARGEHDLDMAEYSISGSSESSVVRQPTQNLWNLKLTQVGGVTTAGSTVMQFSRLLQTGDSADHVIDRNGASTVVWACGGTNTFRKHMAAGAMRLNWTIGGPASLPEDAPPEVPIWVFALILASGGFVWGVTTRSDWRRQKQMAAAEVEEQERREAALKDIMNAAEAATDSAHHPKSKNPSHNRWNVAKSVSHEIHGDHVAHANVDVARGGTLKGPDKKTLIV
jgi:hypothetical protein